MGHLHPADVPLPTPLDIDHGPFLSSPSEANTALPGGGSESDTGDADMPQDIQKATSSSWSERTANSAHNGRVPGVCVFAGLGF